VSAGLFVLWFATELRKARRIRLYQSPMVSTSLVGATGVVSAILSPAGSGRSSNPGVEIHVNGEHWSGEIEPGSADPPKVGASVEVVSVDGNRLVVKPASPGPQGLKDE